MVRRLLASWQLSGSTLPFKKCWDDSKFRRTFMLKALNNMHLILSYQIRQPTITMKFYILKNIRRKLKCFTNSLAFFIMFRYALVEDKTMHFTITFRYHTKQSRRVHSFIGSSQHFLNGSVAVIRRACSIEYKKLLLQL